MPCKIDTVCARKVNSTDFQGRSQCRSTKHHLTCFYAKSTSLPLTQSFWVCEKSDGQRVLVLIVVPPATGIQEVYLVCRLTLTCQIDRKNTYYQTHGIFFPQFKSPPKAPKNAVYPLTNTILDGELVVDTITKGQTKLSLLLFDCLVINGLNVTSRPLSRRYASLQMQLYPAFERFMRANPDAQMMLPFEIKVKPMDLAYGIQVVMKNKIPQLQHGNDGLIFTSFEGPYIYGTNTRILKWKPPHENTIDFKLQLRFPPDLEEDPSGNTPDYRAKPLFQLWQYENGNTYIPFDWLDMDDEEWERWKESGEQLDDRIVECSWHPPSPEGAHLSTWHIKRLRDDKTTGNHRSTVSRILQSMKDGVTEEELVRLVPMIREAWKSPARETRRAELFGKAKQVGRKPHFKGINGPKGPAPCGGLPRMKR